jgi:hypothetical protein
MGTFWEGSGAYTLDSRALMYSYAYASIKHQGAEGAGQFYLMAIRDKQDNLLDGARAYRLVVPAHAPVKQYWSATVYDRSTHALIREATRPSRSSQSQGLQKNADGSVDVYFGPSAPAGKESNWVPTKAGSGFEVLFRLYGPEKAVFDKTWVLPDIEKVGTVAAQTQPAAAANPRAVTVDTFVRAESDRVFAGFVPQGFGKFVHFRELSHVENQLVQRGNRDTLYSFAVLDLEAGPATITLPNAGGRLMSLTVFSQDHYTPGSIYGAGDHVVRKEDVGTRYALAALRTMIDPNDPNDIAAVHALQDGARVRQSNPGRFEIPGWDAEARKKIANALSVLGATLPDWRGAAGLPEEVDPIRHLIVTATGWGLNPEKDATYLNVTPALNDGKTTHRLKVHDVPVDGFWSISVYNAKGYFEPNPQNAYSTNNITAKKEADGSMVIQFGGCDGRVANCLPIFPGWNYMVRLYRPRAEVLGRKWEFPAAQPSN